jgi:hypothetical protein
MSLPLSRSSPPSSLGLVDPYAVLDNFLAPVLDVVSGVGSGPIGSGATGDVVLALIDCTDKVVAIPTVADVLATAEAQRVAAAPTSDMVSATVAVDRVGRLYGCLRGCSVRHRP